MMVPQRYLTPDGRDVLLRAAAPDDARRLLDYLARVGGESSFLTFGPGGIGIPEEEERAILEGYAARDNALFLLALDGAEVVGALSFEAGHRPRTRHVGEFGMTVARVYHRQGVGRALLDGLLEWARAGGVIRKINLRVRVDNAAAVAAYRSAGFVEEGRLSRDLCVDGVLHDVLAMGLQL